MGARWKLDGVGGQYRRDQGLVEEVGQPVRRDLGRCQAVEGESQAARTRGRPRPFLGAPLPAQVLVLGDVGQLQKVAEGTDDNPGLVVGEGIEQGGQFGAGGGVVVAGETYRPLAHLFHQVEDDPALQLTEGRAQDAAEETDIPAQGFQVAGIGAGIGATRIGAARIRVAGGVLAAGQVAGVRGWGWHGGFSNRARLMKVFMLLTGLPNP